MAHSKFEHKIIEISNLIGDNCTADQLAECLDQGPQGLKEYLAGNEDWSHLGSVFFDPVSSAACNGRADKLRLLLSKYGMAVNARYEDGTDWSTNALSWAIVQNKVACVSVLVQMGADKDIGGRYEGTPFRNALDLDRLCKAGNIFCVRDRDDCIKMLLEEEEAPRRRAGERERKKEKKKENLIFPTGLFHIFGASYQMQLNYEKGRSVQRKKKI